MYAQRRAHTAAATFQHFSISTFKKYQHLENIVESPQLPYGYPASMILASLPFLWFSIMNKHIEKYNSSLS